MATDYRIVRSDDEIDDVLNECAEAEESGSKFSGMSYEDGMMAMFHWLTDASEPGPLEP